MSFKRKWKPSKSKMKEFVQKMDEITNFCMEHGISSSMSLDSYYFSINGQKYRVSNHSIESSNAKSTNAFGEEVRQQYHPNGREDDTIYIHASKTRLIEIYQALAKGYKLDGRGYIIE